MHLWIRRLAPLAIIAILSGCGGDDSAGTDLVDSDAGGVAAQDDATQDDAGDGATDILVIGEPLDLADFPIDVADGGDVSATTSAEETRAVVVEYPTSEFDRLVDFYQQWSDAQPDDYTRIEAAEGGIIYQNSDQEAFRSIIVSSPGEDDTMILTLTAADLP